MNDIPQSKQERLRYVLNLAWNIFFERVVAGRIKVNKESSMQLHYSSILQRLGELICIQPGEMFNIELESSHEKKNIDIVCSYGDVKAAIELKCFRKSSNRAVDTDMYDVLKDIERLFSYKDIKVKEFICLTDNGYYCNGSHTGHAGIVSIRNGREYKGDTPISPSWVGKWKDTSRDKDIVFDKNIRFNWTDKDGWYYLRLNL
ncbi:hypothetical protein ACFLUU_01995 [Chloroflexota bacterium]